MLRNHFYIYFFSFSVYFPLSYIYTLDIPHYIHAFLHTAHNSRLVVLEGRGAACVGNSSDSTCLLASGTDHTTLFRLHAPNGFISPRSSPPIPASHATAPACNMSCTHISCCIVHTVHICEETTTHRVGVHVREKHKYICLCTYYTTKQTSCGCERSSHTHGGSWCVA